jgi:predicted TIM-barrel fold metal-dependent hydrolase
MSTELLRIVDAHHHLWEPGPGRYPWMNAGSVKFMGDTSPVCTRYLLEDFQREAATAGLELAGSVHLQCGRDPFDPTAETAWVQAQADAAGLPVAIIGFGNPAAPDFPALLDAHMAHAGFRGIRHMLNWGESEAYRLCDRGDYLRDERWRGGLRRLVPTALSFDLQVNPWQLADAADLARALPGLRIVVNHAGTPVDYGGKGWDLWSGAMARLAEYDNVAVKFSGIGMVDRNWNSASATPLFEHLLARFGAERVMFASNFPIDRLYRSYAETYAVFRALAAPLSAGEQAMLFHGNAARIYRLAIPA